MNFWPGGVCRIPPCQHTGRLTKARHSPRAALWQRVWRAGAIPGGAALGRLLGLVCSPGIQALCKAVVMTCVGVSLSRRAGGAGSLRCVRAPFGKLPRNARVVWYAFRPCPAQCLASLRHLIADLGRRRASGALGVPELTIRDWLRGVVPDSAARRCVWFFWCLRYHPERLSSVEDLETWGRLKERPVVPDDWSI